MVNDKAFSWISAFWYKIRPLLQKKKTVDYTEPASKHLISVHDPFENKIPNSNKVLSSIVSNNLKKFIT